MSDKAQCGHCSLSCRCCSLSCGLDRCSARMSAIQTENKERIDDLEKTRIGNKRSWLQCTDVSSAGRGCAQTSCSRVGLVCFSVYQLAVAVQRVHHSVTRERLSRSLGEGMIECAQVTSLSDISDTRISAPEHVLGTLSRIHLRSNVRGNGASFLQFPSISREDLKHHVSGGQPLARMAPAGAHS